MRPGSISAKDMPLAIFGRKPGQGVHDSLQGLGQSPITKNLLFTFFLKEHLVIVYYYL
jgi:hypothetical protein